MKQFLLEVHGLSQLEEDLRPVRQYCEKTGPSAVLAHVFYGSEDFNKIKELVDFLKNHIPAVQIVGTTSSGEVMHGHLIDPGISITFSVFHQTNVQVMFYDCTNEKEDSAGRRMCEAIKAFPGTVAAEILAALKTGFDSSAFLKELNQCDPDIQVFGAGADVHSGSSNTRVFTGDGITSFGVVGVLYAGADFHICTEYALGWKSLGSCMTATKASKNILYELDGIPAFSIYKKYLQIKNDEQFFNNILEFPLISYVNGYDMTRVPIACGVDGSLILGANLEEGSKVNLAYGDPTAIIHDVLEKQDLIRQFEPEAVFLYSCITRKSFWNYYVNKELEPFETIVPTAGFYTYGEFIRKGGTIMSHNATIVAIGMREGDGTGKISPKLASDGEQMHGQMSMLQRLVNFIQETTKDLEAANDRLEELASRDGLTQLYNRGKIEKLIRERILISYKEHAGISGMMIDIDHFKRVNDEYGHEIGDMVLRKVAERIAFNVGTDGVAGRWGGEEFVVMMNAVSEEKTAEVAERIRQDIENVDFNPVPKVTVSIGVITVHDEEPAFDVYKKVDSALYKAKNEGRNRICIYRD